MAIQDSARLDSPNIIFNIPFYFTFVNVRSQ